MCFVAIDGSFLGEAQISFSLSVWTHGSPRFKWARVRLNVLTYVDPYDGLTIRDTVGKS